MLRMLQWWQLQSCVGYATSGPDMVWLQDPCVKTRHATLKCTACINSLSCPGDVGAALLAEACASLVVEVRPALCSNQSTDNLSTCEHVFTRGKRLLPDVRWLQMAASLQQHGISRFM